MFDILEDTTEEEDTGDTLELDTIKKRILNIWEKALLLHCRTTKLSDEDKAKYLKDNTLVFGEEREEEGSSEEEELMKLLATLDSLMDGGEALTAIVVGGENPDYSGKQLSATNEGRSAPKGTYDSKHSHGTHTQKDTTKGIGSGSYAGVPDGRLKFNKQPESIVSIMPLFEKIREDVGDMDRRRAIGKRRQLFR
jgi:hypothetical protein